MREKGMKLEDIRRELKCGQPVLNDVIAWAKRGKVFEQRSADRIVQTKLLICEGELVPGMGAMPALRTLEDVGALPRPAPAVAVQVNVDAGLRGEDLEAARAVARELAERRKALDVAVTPATEEQ